MFLHNLLYFESRHRLSRSMAVFDPLSMLSCGLITKQKTDRASGDPQKGRETVLLEQVDVPRAVTEEEMSALVEAF